MRNTLFFLLLSFISSNLFSQTSTPAASESYPQTMTHNDSMRLVKLNNSGNLMIAAGVGLCAAGGYLVYQGIKVYNSTVSDLNTPLGQEERDRNHKQGIAYLTGAGVGIVGGVVLVALGAKNKVTFKREKSMMELQTGILDNGRLGAMLTF